MLASPTGARKYRIENSTVLKEAEPRKSRRENHSHVRFCLFLKTFRDPPMYYKAFYFYICSNFLIIITSNNNINKIESPTILFFQKSKKSRGNISIYNSMKEKAEPIGIEAKPIKFRSLFTLRFLCLSLSLTVSSLNDRFLCLYNAFHFLLQYLHAFQLGLVSFFFGDVHSVILC